MKGKNRKDAPRRPKTRLRVGGKMTGRRMLVRQVMPAAWVGTRIWPAFCVMHLSMSCI